MLGKKGKPQVVADCPLIEHVKFTKAPNPSSIIWENIANF
jgi:hypothetical protein